MMPAHTDPLEDDSDDVGDELEFAPAFASGDSLRPAPQEAKDEAQASRTQFGRRVGDWFSRAGLASRPSSNRA